MTVISRQVRRVCYAAIGILFSGIFASVHAADSAAAAPGSTVTFSVTVNGTAPFSYQWRKDGSNLSGATSGTYTIPEVAASHAGKYSVLVSNAAGSTLSDLATLTVLPESNPATAPVITTHPQSQSAAVGANVTFMAAASGSPSPTFQWQKDGANIPGATSSFLTLNSISTASAGSYRVIATNSAGNATSSAATLTVTGGSSGGGATTPPTFTTQPQSQSALPGANISFVAAASGAPTPSYQWQKDGVNIPGATDSILSLNQVSTASGGSYRVIATNSAGSATSSSATLTISGGSSSPTAPAFTTQPQSQTVSAGANVTFTATASGSPAPTYQWQKNGVNISGATNSTLSLSQVTTASAGSYRVIATNSAGSATSSTATLTVTAGSSNSPPTFTAQPQSQTVSVGASVAFSATATGSPTPSYQWQKDGISIPGATSSTLNLNQVTTVSAGSYRVIATNSAGSATSSAATLTVTGGTTSTPPIIVTQPQSQTASLGATVLFTVTATGSPSPSFQWQKNGVNIAGATNATLSLNQIAADSAGSYRVIASNSAGSATSSAATLTISGGSSNPGSGPTNTAPVIIMHPDNQTASPGATVTFTVGASGSPTPTFQWRKNGVEIPGATSSALVLVGITADSAGSYQAVATNAAGSATSAAATLTVTSTGGGTGGGGGGTSINVTTSKVWLMNGTTRASELPLATASATWKIAATADFNGDNRPDIVWQNVVTGQRSVWLMDGTAPVSSLDLGVTDVNLQIRAAADFNGDGAIDLLMQDPVTGRSQIWLVNGTSVTFGYDLALADPSWHLAAAADFTGDGRPDILWENTATGERLLWLMSGTGYAGEVTLGTFDPSWKIVAAADFDRDGQTDILWQNTVTGARFVWFMNGIGYKGEAFLSVADLSWSIAAAADLNGDGHTDILTNLIETAGPVTSFVGYASSGVTVAGSTPTITASAPAPSSSGGGGGGGGGGAPSFWFLLAMGILGLCRRLLRRRA